MIITEDYHMSKRLTQDYVEQQFKDGGCHLLDTYKSKDVPVKFRCSCGQESTITYGSFRRGSRCIECGGKRKYTFEEIREAFEKAGCKLLDDHYVDAFHKMNAMCSCGKPCRTSWNNFQQGRRCMECAKQKMRDANTGSNHYAWITDRNEEKLRRTVTTKCHSALAHALRSLGKNKTVHSFRILKYTPADLKEHIINHPNWEMVKNTKWHLDHIFPVKAFCDYDIKDIAIINSLDNLQPLEGRENFKKHSKYDKKAFEEWLTTHTK